MLFKRTFSILSGLFVVSSTGVLLANNVNFIKQPSYSLQANLDTNTITSLDFDVSEKNLEKSLYSVNETSEMETKISDISSISSKQVVSEGKNYYSYYFLYHIIGLDHDTFVKVDNAIGSGISAVTTVLSVALPELAPVIAAVGAALMFQWKLWDIPSYDTGKGVEIQLFGVTPYAITHVSSQ